MVRRGFALASIALVAAAMACGSIDLAYSPSALSDGGASDGASSGGEGGGSSSGNVQRIIRDSSFEATIQPPLAAIESDAGTCNPDEEDGGGCDLSQGLGCCFSPSGPHCIFLSEVTKYQCTVYVGCRTDEPDTECCWNKSGNLLYTSHSGTCSDGGLPHACLEIDGSSTCPGGGTCDQKPCPVEGGTWQIGVCASAMGLGSGDLSCQ